MMSLKQKSIKDYLIDVMNERQTPKKLLMKEVLNDTDLYDGNDVNKFWAHNTNEFKNGKYIITYDEEGITKIERLDEANIKN